MLLTSSLPRATDVAICGRAVLRNAKERCLFLMGWAISSESGLVSRPSLGCAINTRRAMEGRTTPQTHQESSRPIPDRARMSLWLDDGVPPLPTCIVRGDYEGSTWSVGISEFFCGAKGLLKHAEQEDIFCGACE